MVRYRLALQQQGAPVRVHRSNRLESLMARLASDVSAPAPALQGTPGALVVPETIVVQSRGMERWVSMALAAELGVWAHPRFVYPRSLVHGLVDDVLGVEAEQRGLWDRESLTWAVAARLPGMLDDTGFAPLRSWLSGPDPAGRRLVQLAGQIAYVLDQYGVYRPEMVLAWESGRDLGVGPDDESVVPKRAAQKDGKGDVGALASGNLEDIGRHRHLGDVELRLIDGERKQG